MKFQNCIWRGNPLMRMMPLQKPNDDDNDGKGPRTVSYSICPNFDSLWLG